MREAPSNTVQHSGLGIDGRGVPAYVALNPMRRLFLLVCLIGFGTLPVRSAESLHWNRFRGPNGSGVANDFRPPVKIQADRPAWRVGVPPAHSSPVVWGGRLFLTGVDTNDRLATVALDARKGSVVWKKLLPPVELARVHKSGSRAASTPCVDARQVYAYFGSFGLVCYDHDGSEQWRKPIPTPKSLYGMSTSPVLHDGKVILVLDNDNNLKGSKLSRSKIVAFDCANGDVVWETARPYNRSGWSTPIVWKHQAGAELAVLGNGRAYGYDAGTGVERWYVSGFSRETIATPVIGNGRLHLSASRLGGSGEAEVDPLPFWEAVQPFDANGDGRISKDEISDDFTIPFRPELPIGHPGFGMPLPKDPKRRKQRQLGLFGWRDKNRDGVWTKEEFIKDMTMGRGRPRLVSLEAGGQGDITESHAAWNLHSGIPEIPSPIYHKNRLYLVRAGGLLTCVNGADGDIIYRERLGAPGQYSPSPVIANDHLYLVSARGMITVVKTGDQFNVVHQTDLKAPVPASPAMDQDTLYVRTATELVAFR